MGRHPRDTRIASFLPDVSVVLTDKISWETLKTSFYFSEKVKTNFFTN
jgi:hypothetical protein